MATLDASYYSYSDQPMNSDLPFSNCTTSNVVSKPSTGPPPLKKVKRSNPEDSDVTVSRPGPISASEIQLNQHEGTLLAAGMDQSIFRNGTAWGISGFDTGTNQVQLI